MANARLNREEDKKIDVYAWAVTIFEVIERRNAWDHAEFEVISSSVKSGSRPQFNAETRKKYDSLKYLFDLVQVAWSQNPYERPEFDSIRSQLIPKLAELENQASNSTTIPCTFVTSTISPK